MEYIFYFIIWTLIIQIAHMMAHEVPFLWYFHQDHHNQVSAGTIEGLNWKNYLLIFDTWKSTIDQWLIEVFPTVIFALITKQYWLLVFYYIWAAFIQEWVEHNTNFNMMPMLTSGKYHLVHHKDSSKNYGVFVWWWDWLFGTYDYRKQLDSN